MKTVLEKVNFIRSSEKNNRQFRNCVEEQDEDIIPDDVNYYSITRMLSTSIALSSFVDLFEPTCTIMDEKERHFMETEPDVL